MKHLFLVLGLLLFFATSTATTSAQFYSVNAPTAYLTAPAPLKVTALPLKTGRGDRWLTQPLITVENVSNKPIQYLVIEIGLPGTFDSVSLWYGQMSTNAVAKLNEPLQPGASVNLSLDQNACKAVETRLKDKAKQPRAGSKVNTRISGVTFTDRTGWFDGIVHTQDPANPLRFNVASKSLSGANRTGPNLFEFIKVSAPRQMCWDRLGTEYFECCGFMQPSAIMVQIWGGVFEPIPMSSECEPGVTCEWIKQGGCL
jgi:hypothetical protein